MILENGTIFRHISTGNLYITYAVRNHQSWHVYDLTNDMMGWEWEHSLTDLVYYEKLA